jgi:hypothetical protein
VKVLDKVNYTVVNLVATGNLHQTLDLFKTAMSLDNVEYEPEQFPGAILRISDPKITLLLFKNGKVICAGAKREDLLRQGLEKAQKMVREMKIEGKSFEDEEDSEGKEPAKVKAAAKIAKPAVKAKAVKPAKIKAVKPKAVKKPKPAKAKPAKLKPAKKIKLKKSKK